MHASYVTRAMPPCTQDLYSEKTLLPGGRLHPRRRIVDTRERASTNSPLRHKLLRLLRSLPKEELLHLLDQERPRLGLDGGEPVFVDEHRLMRHPLLPTFLGHIRVDALAEIAGVREVIEAGSLALQENTIDHPCHGPKFTLSTST